MDNKDLIINWYPGHMTKAMRSMKEDIRLVDLIIELVDARAPVSSENPDIAALCNGKKRILILNKADLADESVTTLWSSYYKSRGVDVIVTDSRKSNDKKQIEDAVKKAFAEKRERDKKRGILNRPLRIMIAGIPNVGKSTLINTLAKKSAAKTGDKPGVTKGKQWIKVMGGVELLDTPGVLWPKFDDPSVGIKLALIGSINDNIIELSELACKGIEYLVNNYPCAVGGCYGINESCAPYEVLAGIASARNLLKTGAEPDLDRAAKLFLSDLRAAKIGRISFERPPYEQA
ncbi:MAG: ribosome biogenesis GTPase YlqF [Lachnospiraceae bacterium]|nr:ribosome biogenesis GTPase YlqF [Lachnospiraceae bacterium]